MSDTVPLILRRDREPANSSRCETREPKDSKGLPGGIVNLSILGGILLEEGLHPMLPWLITLSLGIFLATCLAIPEVRLCRDLKRKGRARDKERFLDSQREIARSLREDGTSL